MNLGEIRTDVRERIGEDTADFFTDAEVDRAINLASLTFTAEELWPWLYTEWETTIAQGADELDLPVNVSVHRTFNLSIMGGSLLQGRMLERLAPSAGFRARFEYEMLDQAPRFYYISSANTGTATTTVTTYQVKLIPTADIEYDVIAQYLRVPAELSGATDEPDVPEEFQPALPAWAAGHLFLKELSISNKATEQFQMYFEALGKARKVLEIHPDENIAWSREMPQRRNRTSAMDRIPLTLGP